MCPGGGTYANSHAADRTGAHSDSLNADITLPISIRGTYFLFCHLSISRYSFGAPNAVVLDNVASGFTSDDNGTSRIWGRAYNGSTGYTSLT
jgi:hypothetical protein